MKNRYRLIRRGLRSCKYYCVDTLTGKRSSLGTADRESAEQLVFARNQAVRQPALNLHIARAYLAGSDSGVATRTWQQAFDAIINSKGGANQVRWRTAARDRAFDLIRNKIIMETPPDAILQVIRAGTVSTNVFLRKLHNFCLDMSWLPWPIIPRRNWPAVRYKAKRAITAKEHQAIVERERNAELQAFYQLLWHLGGSQSDVATLCVEDIDWAKQTVSYTRRKTGTPALIHFGKQVAELLRSLPSSGFLFPRLARMGEQHRAKEFNRRCKLLGIVGVSLHSYRYAWAERARVCGYPERFAQEALGHNSKAVHHAYAKRAKVEIPCLEDYEKSYREKVIRLPVACA